MILLISSLSEEYNYLITVLETITEDQLTWDYVRDLFTKVKRRNLVKLRNQKMLFSYQPLTGSCLKKPDEIALKSSKQIKNWWVDSVASQHMAPEIKSFDDYSTFKTPLKLADNSMLYVYGKGNVHLAVLNGNDKINIVLKDFLFVMKL